MFSNSPTTGDWEAFVADALVAYIDAHYRTIAGRGGKGWQGIRWAAMERCESA